jgi:hypothetical protein
MSLISKISINRRILLDNQGQRLRRVRQDRILPPEVHRASRVQKVLSGYVFQFDVPSFKSVFWFLNRRNIGVPSTMIHENLNSFLNDQLMIY